MDFDAEGLLDGLEGEEREDRRRLLEQLVEQGCSPEELRQAVEEDRLVLLPIDRLLGGRLSAREVEQETGVSAELLLRIRRLTGLPEAGPDDPVFGDEGAEVARLTRLFLDSGLSEDAIAGLTRVLGEATSRLAATTGETFAQAFVRAGDSERELAERFADLAERLIPAVGPMFTAAFKAHLQQAVRRGMIGRDQRRSGRVETEQELTVCFADVVGFTRLGSQVEVGELGEVAGVLADRAADLAESPVRLVKTIGDAAMLASPDPAPLVRAALGLVEAFAEADLPALRAGVAQGPVVQRAGDLYGHTVNLASRVTGAARPGSVLCTQEVHDLAKERFAWSYAGRHRLKGLGGPQALHRARRPVEAE